MKNPVGHAALLLCAVFLLSPRAQAEHYTLFLLTGQSNSLGTTNGGEVDPSPGSDPADGQVEFFWHNRVDATTSLGDSGGLFTDLQEQQGGVYPGSATHWGPEINFARTLYRGGVRNFGVIKASRGGGGNTFWSKGSADDHMYQHVVDTVTVATSALTAGGHTFEIAGLLYLQGHGVDANLTTASEWFKKAALQGLPSAALDYGVLVFRGEGVQKDEKIGAQWIIFAANTGNPIAQNRAARAYATGRGVDQDVIEAAKWHTLATNGGRTDTWLDDIVKQLSPEQRKRADELVANFKPVNGLSTSDQ